MGGGERENKKEIEKEAKNGGGTRTRAGNRGGERERKREKKIIRGKEVEEIGDSTKRGGKCERCRYSRNCMRRR